MDNIEQNTELTELTDEQIGLMRKFSRPTDPLQEGNSITGPLPQEPDNESICNEVDEEIVYSSAGREPAR